MNYSTPRTVSFCLIGERPIFLDSRRDRYFALSETLAAAFVALMRDERPSQDAIERLIRGGVIAATPGARLRPVELQIPERSVVETDAAEIPASLGCAWETSALLFGVALELKAFGFARALERRALRRARLDQSIDHAAIEPLAHAFIAARRLVPLHPLCLRDSLGLLDFLARRRQFPDLVLGVKQHPFAAHCWVQTDRRVLNEAVDHAAMYTPIRVI